MSDNISRDNRDEQISRLSKRFTTHSLGRKGASERNRERKSFYLDADLVTQMDSVYHEINHALYPKRVSKSVFLETIIEQGIQNKNALRTSLAALADTEAEEASDE